MSLKLRPLPFFGVVKVGPLLACDLVRLTRKDKEFCDSRCRQNYHYHNRIKPSQKS